MSTATERANALLETRARVWNEAETFLQDLKGEEMSVEQRTQWDRYNERIDGLATEIDQLTTREQREHEAGAVREAQAQAFGREPDDNRADWNTRIRDWARGEVRMDAKDEDGKPFNGFATNVLGVRRERELIRSGASPDEVRALLWDTGSSASAVPTLFDRQLYEVLQEEIAGLRMPTTVITTDSGASMEFPRVSAHAIATQVSGQGTALAGTDPTFAKLTLTPVKYAELIDVSSELVSDSGVDMVGFLARDLGRAVGRRVNEAIVTGMIGAVTVGSGGTVSTGGTLITPTFAHLINLEYSVNDSYRNSTSAAWLAKDSTAGTLRKLRDGAGGTEGSPLWQPSVQTGIAGQRQPDQLFGHPFFTDTNVAAQASNAKILFFGDWRSYYSRFVGNPLVERNDSVSWKNDEVSFRGKWRAAGGYQDLTAVNLLKQSV